MFNIKKLNELSERLKLIFIVVTIAIVLISTFFTNKLTKTLAIEEQKKVLIWAEATRQLIIANENSDIDFISSIIEGNTTIPVIMTDANDQMLFSRNIKEPDKEKEQFYKKEVERLKEKRAAIEVKIDHTTQ